MATKRRGNKKKNVEKTYTYKECAMKYSEKCVKDSQFNPRKPNKPEGKRLDKEIETSEKWKAINFYRVINNNLFKGDTVHICKDCIREYVYKDKEQTQVDMQKFKKILQLLDVPFFELEFKSSEEGRMETIGAYMKNIYLNYKGSSYEDGDLDEFKKVVEESIQTEKDIRKFWGRNFTDEEYDFLEEELEDWKKTHKCDNKAELTLLKEICIQVLVIRRLRDNNKPFEKAQKTLQELMKTASVDPAKSNAISAGKSVDRFGVWLADIEQYKPAEWHSQQDRYVDMDGFKQYIKDYIVRPIKNFFTGTKDFLVEGKDLSFKDDDFDSVDSDEGVD